jgi:hypothetical protein
MIGGFHVNDSAYCACAVIAWGSAGLAVQQVMGVLPQRRTRLGGRGLTCAARGRTAVKPRASIRFSGADALVIW